MSEAVDLALVIIGAGAALAVVAVLLIVGAAGALAIIWSVAAAAAWLIGFLFEMGRVLLDLIWDKVAEWRGR